MECSEAITLWMSSPRSTSSGFLTKQGEASALWCWRREPDEPLTRHRGALLVASVVSVAERRSVQPSRGRGGSSSRVSLPPTTSMLMP